MTELKRAIMKRDGLTSGEADDMITYAKFRVEEGDDLEEVLQEEFGLEADYAFDLID